MLVAVREDGGACFAGRDVEARRGVERGGLRAGWDSKGEYGGAFKDGGEQLARIFHQKNPTM